MLIIVNDLFFSNVNKYVINRYVKKFMKLVGTCSLMFYIGLKKDQVQIYIPQFSNNRL